MFILIKNIAGALNPHILPLNIESHQLLFAFKLSTDFLRFYWPNVIHSATYTMYGYY